MWQETGLGTNGKEIEKLANDDLPESFSLGSLIDLNIAKVREKLGKAEEVVTGDASTSEHSVCYEGNDKSLVAFAEDEMGITVEFYKNKKSSFLKKCLKSYFVSKNLTTRRGLKLGLTRNQTKKIYGNTSKSTEDYDLYRFRKNRSPTQPFCEDYEDIFIHFHKGHVDKFTLSRGSVDC